MNDDARNLLGRALPDGQVPFRVDAEQIVRRGRRVRRRRAVAAIGGIAGVAALGMMVVIVGLPPGSSADHDPAASSGAGEKRDDWSADVPWQQEKRDPFTSEDTRKAAAGVVEGLQGVAGVQVNAKDVEADLDFGRYTETSPNGDLTRDLFLGEGRFAVKAQDLTTDFEVSVYEPGLVDDPGAFVDCDAKRVECSDSTGPDGELIVTRDRDTVSGELTIRTREVYVYRADQSIAKLTVRPNVTSSTDAVTDSGAVTTPLSLTQLHEVAIAIPLNLKI